MEKMTFTLSELQKLSSVIDKCGKELTADFIHMMKAKQIEESDCDWYDKVSELVEDLRK